MFEQEMATSWCGADTTKNTNVVTSMLFNNKIAKIIIITYPVRTFDVSIWTDDQEI